MSGVTTPTRTLRPKRCNASQLAKVGVERDRSRPGIALRCKACAMQWGVVRDNGYAPLPRGYWKCPNGCNLGE
jgi:hypothetical protein